MRKLSKRVSKKRAQKKAPEAEKPRRLTYKEINTLTEIAFGTADNGPCQGKAFLLLIREIELVHLNEPQSLENVTRVIRDRVFSESGDAFHAAQDECIERYRRKFFEVHGEKSS